MRANPYRKNSKAWITVLFLAVLIHLALLFTLGGYYRNFFSRDFADGSFQGGFEGDFTILELGEDTEPPKPEERPREEVEEPELELEVLASEILLDLPDVERPVESAETGADQEIQEPSVPASSGEGALATLGADAGASIRRTYIEPRLVYWAVPEYPKKVKKIDGEIELRIFVSEEGKVKEAEIVSGMPIAAYNDAVLNAVRRSRWEPGLLEGRAVEMWTTFTYRFTAK